LKHFSAENVTIRSGSPLAGYPISPPGGDLERDVFHMAKALRPGTKPKSGLAATETMTRRSGSAPSELAPLNFKVTKAFRREFKTYASQHDMKMVELLQEAFRLVKEHHADSATDPKQFR
jgi:hypothetical protein